MKKIIKETIILISPILLQLILSIPYRILNSLVIVKLLGCGCPQMDENGNEIISNFNANDFTKLFWLFVSICVSFASIFLARRIPKDKKIFRAIYILVIIVITFLLSYRFISSMMWN